MGGPYDPEKNERGRKQQTVVTRTQDKRAWAKNLDTGAGPRQIRVEGLVLKADQEKEIAT